MFSLKNLNNNYRSYQHLINFYQEFEDYEFNEIEIELSGWFSANLSAALGAILDKFLYNYNEVSFIQIDNKIHEILSKNKFLLFWGDNIRKDFNNTTIHYQKIKKTDGRFFKSYIQENLIGRKELPNMSKSLKDKISEAIYELFVNAQIHSETDYIYTCGQVYPNKNRIDFTIVDTGIGIKNKINKAFKSNISADKAIGWALENGNTTKKDISGGIGLTILKEFIQLNKGKLQIVSNDGFLEINTSHTIQNLFVGEFPGTIVNIEFCTDDNSNYYLNTLTDINEIF